MFKIALCFANMHAYMPIKAQKKPRIRESISLFWTKLSHSHLPHSLFSGGLLRGEASSCSSFSATAASLPRVGLGEGLDVPDLRLVAWSRRLRWTWPVTTTGCARLDYKCSNFKIINCKCKMQKYIFKRATLPYYQILSRSQCILSIRGFSVRFKFQKNHSNFRRSFEESSKTSAILAIRFWNAIFAKV